MRIIACFKWVKDEGDIRINGASRELETERASHKISLYDCHALEEAVQLRESYGGSVIAATVARPADKQCLKDALSRGPEKAYFIQDESFGNLEPSQTARILGDALAGKGEYDLILCGEGSSDLYAQQVGPALAEHLGIACVTSVNKIEYEAGKNRLRVERKLEEGKERVSVELPAVVCVLPDINSVRIPSLKQVLGAAKKPVEAITLSDLGHSYESRLRTVKIQGSKIERKRQLYGTDEKGIQELVQTLIKQGISK